MRKKTSSTTLSQGFTLVELLVVIGVMAVMLSVASVGIQNIDKGQGTVAGISQVQALMDEARSIAVSRGTRARLCVHAEPEEEDRNLKFVVVAYEELLYDADGEIAGTRWRVASRGTYLPSGIYFHPSLSKEASQEIRRLGHYGENGEGIKFPWDGKSSKRPNYYYYEFNSEGLCFDQQQQYPGAAFVLCRGITGPGAKEPRVVGNDVAGFVVWRNGRTAEIRETGIMTQ